MIKAVIPRPDHLLHSSQRSAAHVVADAVGDHSEPASADLPPQSFSLNTRTQLKREAEERKRDTDAADPVAAAASY